MSSDDLVTIASSWITDACQVTVLTGAGISAESGVPTFRGADGLWRNFRAEELATPAAFARDPNLIWQWYDWRREVISKCQPNAAHAALKALEQQKSGFCLITQNVDGLHDQAGSVHILKLHGDIWNLRCVRCDYNAINRHVPLHALPPKCPKCSQLLRPDVVWFGEMLDARILQAAMKSAVQCDLFVVIGTSALVQPAASLPLEAKSSGAKVIEINLEPTALSQYADMSLNGAAAKIVPLLIGCL